MSSQLYKSPPITEAVIEMRFGTPLTAPELGKVSRDFVSDYPNHQQIAQIVDVSVGLPPAPEEQPTAQVNRQLGYRLSSSDLAEILMLFPAIFAVAQLAPYPGWEAFFPRFVRDWKTWKKEMGYRNIARVGVRFINRIDIPIGDDGIIEESEYLNVYPALPDTLGQMTGYGVQVQLPIRDMGCKLTINSAAVPSPLLGHGSILLDFDIAMEGSPPQNDEQIYELLNRIRVKKNEVFEACVTKQAKEIFQK